MNLPSTKKSYLYFAYKNEIVPVSDLDLQNDCLKILLAERREELNEVIVYELLVR